MAANQSALRHALGTSAARVTTSTKSAGQTQTNKTQHHNRSVSKEVVTDVMKPTSTTASSTPTTTTLPVTVRSGTPKLGANATACKDNSSSTTTLQNEIDNNGLGVWNFFLLKFYSS